MIYDVAETDPQGPRSEPGPEAPRTVHMSTLRPLSPGVLVYL